MPIFMQTPNREDSVGTPTLDYVEQEETWCMIHDLLGGTKAMRLAAERWLPREEREEQQAYLARLSRTFLYNGFGNTVDRLTAKPFSHSVTRQGELPEDLAEIEANVDKAGTTLGELARCLFKSALKYGRSHVLVDYTEVPAGATIADEKRIGARPTMVMVEAPDLIGWRTELGPNGMELTQIRIRECRNEPTGEYLDEKVEYIRVFTKTTWELWRKSTDDRGKEVWTKNKEGVNTFGAIPLLTYYMEQTGYLKSKCPLEDLAWVNLRHWQSSSEQNSVLRIARIGILFGSGFTEDEVKKGIVIGPNHMIMSESLDAKLEYVEHAGQAIKAGQDDLDKLESRMEVLGLKPVIERTSNSTFGGKMIDEMATHSNIQSWVGGLELFLLECMGTAATWKKRTIPPEVKYDIYSDFGLQSADAVHLDTLLQACLGGKLSDKTFLMEYQRRAVISSNVKVDEELKALETQRAEAAKIEAQKAESARGQTNPLPVSA